MRDLRSGRVMALKAALFVVIGVASCALILAEMPDWRIALLLSLAIWAFCRAYYFAFYVIEHYIDPDFKYTGLFAALRHGWTMRGTKKPGA